MPDTQVPLIVETLCEALETMAFISVMPAEPPDTPPAELRRVSIQFTKPEPGSIELLAPAAFGQMLAANLLGTDPADPIAAAGADDAVRELVNVACGSLLHKHGGASAEPLLMSVPQVRAAGPEEWQPFIASAGAHLLDGDGIPFAVRLIGIE